jgi:hypothetical protein
VPVGISGSTQGDAQETLTHQPVIPTYLRLMDDQREKFFERLHTVPEARLWERPEPKKWAPAEHIDHARVLTRCLRRILSLAWTIGRPYGRLRRARAYETSIDDVYERPDFPLQVGWLWPPKNRPDRPIPLSTLQRLFEHEHGRLHAFFTGKDERVLGQIRLYDPAIGWVNPIQGLRIVVYHDAHHFAIASRQLGLSP